MQIKRLIFLAVGTVFLVMGILGFFLPVLQGILFTLIGLYFLSKGSKTAEKIFHKLRDKFPREYEFARRVKRRIVRAISVKGPDEET